MSYKFLDIRNQKKTIATLKNMFKQNQFGKFHPKCTRLNGDVYTVGVVTVVHVENGQLGEISCFLGS